jgi:Tfp pilus assembly protein PilF
MRVAALFVMAGLALAQAPDLAYPALEKAYEALKTRDYDTAIANFLKGIEAAPTRASIRKDLAYTYLKVGENILARDQFREAMAIDPQDTQVAMEYAFLCYETKEQAQARRIFDRLRKTGNSSSKAATEGSPRSVVAHFEFPTVARLGDEKPEAGNSEAEQAFQNIDVPLVAEIARWKKAIEMGGDNFSARFDLATLAEQRDELPLAVENYEKAWRLLPDRRSVLVDLGRVLKAMHEDERANAALLAASRGGETRTAEMARELLPERYPYVAEFRKALELDTTNVDLRREFGFLLLRMDRTGEAEAEFRKLADPPPGDLMAVTQLGFLLYSRGQHDAAMPYFNRVLAANDQDLSNRVRSLLRMPLVVVTTEPPLSSTDAKAMAERSLQAGYMPDALRYLEQALEADPDDFAVMLKLGWTNNILHRDAQAFHWFDLARASSDPKIALEASHAWSNLRGDVEPFRTTAWFYPLYSTRWHDLFGYAQVKTELRTHFGLIPYASVRFVGDTRGTISATVTGVTPQYLSESSFIVGVGVRTATWQGVTGWFEAGSAMGYLTGHMLPDFRGGISAARGIGKTLGSESAGFFADTTLDAIFVSRFGNDFLVYSQSRGGYSFGPSEFRAQLYMNGNATIDDQRQAWANFAEFGPGIRIHAGPMPKSMYVTVNLLRGMYFLTQGYFNDLRVGVWYAFTR